jgi:CheY-like chemotaxis protein
MRSFKVYIIEDSTLHGRKLLKSIEALNDSSVSPKLSRNWEDAGIDLEKGSYDLVIADVIVYKNKDEELRGQEANFDCLDALIQLRENKYPPMPIVIFTDKRDLEQLQKYHDHIADYWYKPQIDPDFLQFKIKKLRWFIEQWHPTSLFINILRNSMNEYGCTGWELPWNQYMLSLLNEFEMYPYGKDQAIIALDSLLQMATSIRVREPFSMVFKRFIEIDTATSSLLSIRPHLHHSIHTFFLGYYLFNLSGINWVEILKGGSSHFRNSMQNKIDSHVSEDEAVKYAWLQLNYAWFIASLLHDTGLIAEKYNTIVSNLIDAINELRICQDMKVETPVVTTDAHQALSNALKQIDSKYTDYIESKYKDNKHGILSALQLIQNFSNNFLNCEVSDGVFLIYAAEASALHDSYTEEGCPQIDLRDSPIAGILAICDAVQSWDRDKSDKSLFGGDYIDRVELCDIKVNKTPSNGPAIFMTIRYYPHNMAVYDLIRKEIMRKLRDALNDKVLDALTKKITIRCAPEHKFRIIIDFYLGNERIIEPLVLF